MVLAEKCKYMSGLKVPEEMIVYSKKPENSLEYTKKLDKEYSKYAKVYDVAVKVLPDWKTWIKTVIPYIEGNSVLKDFIWEWMVKNRLSIKKSK